jgi:hypothetical protein
MKRSIIVLFLIGWWVPVGLGGCKPKNQVQAPSEGLGRGQDGKLFNREGAESHLYEDTRNLDIKENLIRISGDSIVKEPEAIRMQFTSSLTALRSDRPEKQSAAIAALSKLACRESVFVLGALLENKEENMKWRALGNDLIMPDGRPVKRRSRIIYEPLSHLAVKALGSLAISDLKKVGEFDRVGDGDLEDWRGWWVLHKDLFKPIKNEPTGQP